MCISNELRVGIMFLTGLIILVFGIATLTDWWPGRKGYTISIRFAQAQGVREGAEVRIAGVKIGQISSVAFDSRTSAAIIKARIVADSVPLYDHYTYSIGIGGLVGERYIDISPQPGEGKLLRANGEVDGEESGDINMLISNANSVVTKLVQTADSLNSLIGDEQMKANLHQSAANLQATTAASASLVSQMSSMVGQNQGAVNFIVADLQATAADIRRVSDVLAPQMANSKMFGNLDEASYNAMLITRRLESITHALDTMVNDPAIAASMRETLANLQQTSADLEETMQQMRLASGPLAATVQNIHTASGNITTMSDNLQAASSDLPKITGPLAEIAPETAENLLEISRQFRQTSERINGIAERVGGITDGVKKLGSSLASLTVEPEARMTALISGQNTVRSDFNVNLFSDDNLFRLGITDIGRSNGMNIQFGNRINSEKELWFRYGVVQSRFGAGVDYKVNENLHVTGEVFDPAGLRMNLLADYRMRSLGTGWWLSSGLYDIFEKNSFGVGIIYKPK